MKKVSLIGIILLFLSVGLFAQKKNTIKTDLFSAFLRTGVIKYERAFTDDISAQLGFFYTGWNVWGTETSMKGWALTPEIRLYLSDTPAPQGTYLAPNLRYMSLRGEDLENNESATLNSLEIAINLGKQWLLKDIVVIDGWVGPAYAFRTAEDELGSLDLGPLKEGFWLRLGLAIGVNF